MDTSKNFTAAANGATEAADALERMVQAAGMATAHTGFQR